LTPNDGVGAVNGRWSGRGVVRRSQRAALSPSTIWSNPPRFLSIKRRFASPYEKQRNPSFCCWLVDRSDPGDHLFLSYERTELNPHSGSKSRRMVAGCRVHTILGHPSRPGRGGAFCLFAAGSDSGVRHCGSQVLTTPWDRIQLRESGRWGRLVDGVG